MMSLKEIKVQIALGVATKGNEIALLVEVSDDPKAISWASKHKYAAVRKVAVQSPLCPFTSLVKLSLMDSSTIVRACCKASILNRQQEFRQLLEVLEEFPQLSLALKDKRKPLQSIQKISNEMGTENVIVKVFQNITGEKFNDNHEFNSTDEEGPPF